MTDSFSDGAPAVNADAIGPLFRVGEIWDREDFAKRLGGDSGRKMRRLQQAGLIVWDAAGTGMVLIDQLAEMIRSNAEVPKYLPQYKERKKRKRE